MDSPEPSKTISSAAAAISASAAASSDSPVQESPFSNFLSNLSPINPVKAEHVPQGFLGLNSPPLVFTSPRTTLHHRTSFLQRSQLSHISSLETPEKDDVTKNLDGSREPETYCRKLIHDIQEDNDVKNNTQDQLDSLSGCPDEYLNNSEECINSVNLLDQNVKQSNDVLQSSISSLSIATSHEKSHTRTEFETSVLFEPVKGTRIEQFFNENKPVYHEEDHSSIDHGPAINQCDVYRDQANEDVENVKTTLQGSIQNVEQCDLEVSQLQRGLSRRCLQFEEAGRKSVARSIPSSNKRDTTIDLGSLPTTKNIESLGSPHVDSTASSNKTKMLNLSQLAISAFPPSAAKSHTVVPKPSGIGLHLNSIAVPKGSNSSVVIAPSMNSNHVENKAYSERLSKLVQKVVLAPRDDMSEPLSSLTISGSNSELCQPVKPSNTMLPPKDYVAPPNKRNFDLEHADNFEEVSQLSPTNKKRKTSLSADGDGCKRCNCKKTKCLKLYCDCFAAGIYCGEGCACQGCFNKPEHEDTVMEARQLIESRNPLAFAPKVVQHVADRTLIKEDGSRMISSLARHKRGCNCKKSMCLKKYCECYQANVGCSTECRCEGCRNTYGKKEEYCATEEILHNRVFKERYGGEDDHDMGMVSNKCFSQAELQDPHSLTPSTPSSQHSDHGKDVAISDFSNLSSYTRHTRSPRNSSGNDVIPEGNKETSDIDSLGQEMDYSVAEMMDQFSPGRNSLAGIYDLTPSHNSSTAAQAPSASSKTKDCVGSSRFQLCSGNSHSSGHSLRWRSSPITPMPELGEMKSKRNDSEGGNHDNLGDETPEMLKESSTSVKATSPNKKRVSPPQHHVHGLRASSSVGLRRGLKFILTAISSSSSLNPCNQSNGQTDDKSSNN